MRCFVPSCYELVGMLRGPEERLELLVGVVVEAEVGGDKFLFEDRSPGEQHHGGSLHLIGRHHKNFPVSLEKRSRDSTLDVLGERNRSIVQADLKGIAMEVDVAGMVHAGFVQSDVAQPRI